MGSGLLYSFNGGLGVNFTALYDYYLSSPLNLFVFLVPEKYLMEFFSYLAVIKIGLAGSAFCYYLSRHFDIDVISGPKEAGGRIVSLRIMLLAFSLFYALSGYIAAYNWDLMWLDVVALSPVVILGLERLAISGGKDYRLYVISLAVSLICNYYLCIMLCIYIVLYYLFVLLPGRNVVKNLLSFAGSSLLAGGIAGIVLIPSVLAVRMTGFADSSFPSSFKFYFSLLDMSARHLTDVTVETGLDHWPNIYASVAVLILLPLYIICRQIPLRKKIGSLILLAFLFVSFSVNVLSYLWHGFNYPDSLPARQSYLYIFLLLTLCFEAIMHLEACGKIASCVIAFAALGYITAVQKLVHDDAITERTIALSAVFTTAYLIMLHMYVSEHAPGKKPGDKDPSNGASVKITRRRTVICGIALATVILEAGLNMKFTSVPTVSRNAYLKNFDEYKRLYDENNELNMTQASSSGDAEYAGGLFYRFEREERLTNNDAMLKAYPSISMFSSIGNGRINDFYKKYGMRASKVFYCADGATPFIRELLGNKYVFVEDKYADLWKGMNGPGISRTDGSPDKVADPDVIAVSEVAHDGEVGLYAFNNSLPVGYMVYTANIDVRSVIDVSGKSSVSTSADDLNPVERQNELARALGASGDMYEPVSEHYEETETDIGDLDTPGYYVAYCNTKRIDTLNVTLPSGTKKCRKLKNPYIIDLGYLNKDDRVHIDQGDTEDPVELKMRVYRLDTKIYNDLIGQLASDVYNISAGGYGPGRLSGQIEAKGEGYMILSIPYDEGFAIMVDGQKSEAYPAMGMMMAIPLGIGRHSVDIRYIPRGLNTGVALTLLSLIISCCLIKRSENKKDSMGGKQG